MASHMPLLAELRVLSWPVFYKHDAPMELGYVVALVSINISLLTELKNLPLILVPIINMN